MNVTRRAFIALVFGAIAMAMDDDEEDDDGEQLHGGGASQA